jgi:hypothetical protein
MTQSSTPIPRLANRHGSDRRLRPSLQFADQDAAEDLAIARLDLHERGSEFAVI